MNEKNEKKCSVCDKVIKMIREDETFKYFKHCGIPQSIYKKGINKNRKKAIERS